LRYACRLVPVSSRVILWRHDQTTALLRTLVNSLDNIDEFLLIFEYPVEFVVVARAEIAHHVFVAKEEHEGDGIVEFVHLFEVRDLIEVAYVDDRKVFDSIGDLIENFVLAHAVRVPVTAEPDYHEAFVFGEDGLVDVPGSDEMGDDDGPHDGELCLSMRWGSLAVCSNICTIEGIRNV
jgi:hypothetical protein